jgi:glycosyltransferase involved in cell wall biosynthesis
MPMKILLVSQMYPGPAAPDLGVFVKGMAEQLAARGHRVERAVLDRRRRGKLKYLELTRDTLRTARRFEPDVVYAHFLVPSGLIAALAGRAPLVVTAHGRDVRNVGWLPGLGAATRFVVGRAASVIAVSDYLRRELEAKVPEARGKTEVVDSGVDLERFQVEPSPDGPARYLCIGSLIERKNVLRLADAFERIGEGTLTFVGDGPLRPQLEGRAGIELTGALPYDRIPAQISAAHVVCQPSLIEPFGQAALEAMASGRSVVATRIGGPPEFVPAEAGVLVDPADPDALLEGLRSAAALPRPNAAARAAAEAHDIRLQAEKVEAILRRAARGQRA